MNVWEFLNGLTGPQWIGVLLLAFILACAASETIVGVARAIAGPFRKKD